MPPRAWRLRVQDILDGMDRLNEYTAGMDFEAFARDPKTVDAVLRQITIIGEAARHIPDAVCERHPDVPWRILSDFRNVVVHAYFGVNLRIVWETVRNDLPPLASALADILRSKD
jgi:uncharacterized protein with HEPN domain